MRKFKKFLCAALASTMVFAMAAPSFAAETGTIVIKRPVNENGNVDKTHTYKVYRLFTVESHTDDDHYAYKVEEVENNKDFWKAFFENEGWNINEEGYLISRPDTNTVDQELANRALKYAKDNGIAPTYTLNSDETGVAEKGDALHGYYLIDSTVGTLCVLNTSTLEISDKNVAPSLTKRFVGDEADISGSEGVQVGGKANYEITVVAQPNTNDYVIHDHMSEALTFTTEDINSVKVTFGDTSLVRDVDYRIELNPEHTDSYNCTFEIHFIEGEKFSYGNISQPTDIKVNYSATVNEKAYEDGIKITNSAKLAYNNGEETPDNPTPELKTYEFELQKISSETRNELQGAKFTLSKQADGTNPVYFVSDEDGYRAVPAGTENASPEIVVGRAMIKGLDNAHYYLTEIEPPRGYNKLDAPDEFTLTRVTGAQREDNAEPDKQVANSTGAMLPSTGGIGTTIFYVVGIILMAGAVFFVVRRKKA